MKTVIFNILNSSFRNKVYFLACLLACLLTYLFNNKYLENVMKHEENKPMRVGKELLESMNTDDNNQLKPRMISKKDLQAVLEVK